MREGLGMVLSIAASGILYSMLEFLIPPGRLHRSASIVIRMIVLLSVSDILLEYLR